MYKFNFLAKINQQKLEERKRNRLVSLVFFSSVICMVGLLAVTYLYSKQIGSRYREVSELKLRTESRSRQFRSSDFFRYRHIQNVYNVATKRKKMSAVLDVVESAIDSTIIITSYRQTDSFVQVVLLAKITGSRSQLMNIANTVKDRINDNLIDLRYVDPNKPVRISRFPDIRDTINELQYWEFTIDADLEGIVKEAPEIVEEEEPAEEQD